MDKRLKSFLFTVETKLGIERADEYFNDELGRVLEGIQNDGYTIVDVKISEGFTASMTVSVVRFLVLYK